MESTKKIAYSKRIFRYPLKKWALLLIAIGIYIVLHKLFEELLSKTAVQYLFSYIETSWFNDIIFAIVIVYVSIFLTLKIKSYIPSLNILLFITIVI